MVLLAKPIPANIPSLEYQVMMQALLRLVRITHHRGAEGEERTGKTSGGLTILTGFGLTHFDSRLVCCPLCSLWPCGSSFAFRALSGLLLGCVFAGGAVCAAAAESRTWTDSTGKYKIVAEFQECRDGQVQLKTENGRMVSLPLDKLSAQDQAYVEQLTSRDAAIPAAAGRSDPLAPSPGPVTLELATGARITGTITARDERFVTMEVVASGRTLSRKYPVDGVQAVTVAGKRVELKQPGATSAAPRAAAASAAPAVRTESEIDRLIDELGRTTPDWWAATPLNYPKTLDLTWPQKAEGPWDPQKNVGQYLWDIVHPNSGKWREGVRLIHFLLERHAKDKEKRGRAMRTLGRMYFLLLRDYARAAFWWRQAGVESDANWPEGIELAECYWRLGNKQMALKCLRRNTVYFTTIKLLADMGETRQALELADGAARGGWSDLAYLYAGDACRIEGRYDEALRYYKKVLDVKPQGNAQKRVERNQERARTNIQAIEIYDNLQLSRVRDGTYNAAAPGYAGSVRVEVAIRGGRIEAVRVTDHQEKQYYGAIAETPAKIIEKQGVKGVDATTSATITSEAIINATALALTKGLR